jgi:putative ABC transport system permease protein
MISGQYFETAGIPLKRGRLFTDEDRPGSPLVAIVNETMARTFWPGQDPIGKRFRLRASEPWTEVVGVTGDIRRQGLENKPAPQIFRPQAQRPDDMMDIVVRTSADPQSIASAVRNEIQSIDRTVAKFEVTTVERQIAAQTEVRRFQTSLFGLFSVMALLMSAIGIYGLMHFFVVQRTNEIGVRMALGARSADVLGLVLRQGLTLAAAGIAVGLAAALGATRLLASLLFGVTPADPLTFASTAAILIGVAALACSIPARRAARVDPVLALRQD